MQQGYKLLHFEMLNKIAEGGQGEVWLAFNPSTAEKVVIKLPNEDARTSLAEEHEILLRIRKNGGHPNILGVIDYFASHYPPFLVLEYKKGVDLAAHVNKRGPIEPDVFKKPLMQLLDALEFAHKNNIFHRDIKPANILYDEEGNNAYLLDFGLGKIQEESVSRLRLSASVDKEGLVGTAEWIPPEVREGNKYTVQSDIYGLGLITIYALTGQRPATREFWNFDNAQQKYGFLRKFIADVTRTDPFFRPRSILDVRGLLAYKQVIYVEPRIDGLAKRIFNDVKYAILVLLGIVGLCIFIIVLIFSTLSPGNRRRRIPKTGYVEKTRKSKDLKVGVDIPEHIDSEVTLEAWDYYISDVIHITSKGKLIIPASTELRFKNHSRIICEGILIVNGTTKKPVIFAPTYSTNIKGDLIKCGGSVVFVGKTSSKSRIRNCRIEDFGGISIDNPYVKKRLPDLDVDGIGGGVICIDGASPVFEYCTISGNEAIIGGGVCCIDSSPTFDNCQIINNSADMFGGGVYCSSNSSPIFKSCKISLNKTSHIESAGGAVYSKDSSIKFTDTHIYNNTVFEKGAGVYLLNSTAVFVNTQILLNKASGGEYPYGGGLYCKDCKKLEFDNCTISNNSAWSGGGIFGFNSNFEISDSTMQKNTAEYYTGGACKFIEKCEIKLQNVKITNNKAKGKGGGIWLDKSSNLQHNADSEMGPNTPNDTEK